MDGEVVHVFMNLDTSPQLQPIIRRHLKYTKIKVKPANTFCLEIRLQCVLTEESIKGNQYCVSMKCSVPFVHQKMGFFSFLFSHIWHENTIIIQKSFPHSPPSPVGKRKIHCSSIFNHIISPPVLLNVVNIQPLHRRPGVSQVKEVTVRDRNGP